MAEEEMNKVQACANCVYYNELDAKSGECRRYPPDSLLNGLVGEEHEREDVPAEQLVSAAGVPRLRNRFFWTLRADLGSSFRVVSPEIWCGEFMHRKVWRSEADEPSKH